MQGQTACFGWDLLQELRAPGGCREHTEQALQLLRRESTIMVLQAEGLQ